MGTTTKFPCSAALLLVCIVFGELALGTQAKSFEEDLTLTLNEKFTLDKFKDRMIPRLPHKFMKEDIFLIRWLRARNFNIPAAEEMLSSYLQWRDENGIDGIHNEDWEEYKGDYKYWLAGRDLEGRPILYLNLASWDIRKAVVAGKRDRLMRYLDMGIDEACTLVRDLGKRHKNVTQGIIIMNLQGFSIVQHACVQCVGVLLSVISTYENHHPGCSEKFIILNTPAIAEPIIQIAKEALSKETREALTIIGTNRYKIRNFLSRSIDLNQLPPEVGGTALYPGIDSDY